MAIFEVVLYQTVGFYLHKTEDSFPAKLSSIPCNEARETSDSFPKKHLISILKKTKYNTSQDQESMSFNMTYLLQKLEFFKVYTRKYIFILKSLQYYTFHIYVILPNYLFVYFLFLICFA